jgi:hypothetical protein
VINALNQTSQAYTLMNHRQDFFAINIEGHGDLIP